jgi:GMP synthase-like glutamine amidotransferase
MVMMEKNRLRVAILDLNEGQPNQGMRCLREILSQYAAANNTDLTWDEFEVRLAKKLPGLSYDMYISSGGPGSPLESEGSEWEAAYFHWLQQVEDWNRDGANLQKKFVFFICHSYQLVCRHYKIAQVTKRKSTAFGVFPVHASAAGKEEPVFAGLAEPFYAVDSRDFQVIQPNHQRLRRMGAIILCIEKERPHVPLERAIMGIRFNKYMIGTQFHPEADAMGMTMYLLRDDRKKTVIDNYGFSKWQSMIEQLNDPDKIRHTNATVIPNFLHEAATRLAVAEAV